MVKTCGCARLAFVTDLAARLTVVDQEVAPTRRKDGRESPERVCRRSERATLLDALRALPPGKALRVDGVPVNLRPTWRGRARAASKALGVRYAVRVRGETVWLVQEDPG